MILVSGCSRTVPIIDPVQELPAEVATIVAEMGMPTAAFDTPGAG